MWIRKADLEGVVLAGFYLFFSQKLELLPTFGSFLLGPQPTEGLLQAKIDFPKEGTFIFVANPQTHPPSHNSALLGP